MSNTLYNLTSWGQLNTHYHLTTYPSSPQSTYDMTTDRKTDRLSQTTRKPTQTIIPTNIHTANIIFTNIILVADKRNIPKGKMHSNPRLLPNHIVYKITQINNICRANTSDPALELLNQEITSNIHTHKQNIWKRYIPVG